MAVARSSASGRVLFRWWVVVLLAVGVWAPCRGDGLGEGLEDLVVRVPEPGVGFAGDLDRELVLRVQQRELFLRVGGQLRGHLVRGLIRDDADRERRFGFARDGRRHALAAGDLDGVDGQRGLAPPEHQ